ncbi:MAG: dihydroorotate dehydrogenase electron transfer subunit [Bacteroidales bacterium]|nr:dihydroorotate dehydrogenase electron transfer subunit [Bacteroidales bacterium]MCF8343542.1 dihydroorotate dehydrogenase electron transfer subunit [Bacteroidales bacterium]MCF8375593.1 dihydroorotate dehydrogenase electron transfer subunit [Bacteroidales bacterium]
MKQIRDFRVKAYDRLNEDNYIIELGCDEELPAIKAGNFAEIQVPQTADVFLRRPFSILDADHKNRSLKFYVKAIGKGTRKLGELAEGTKVNLIFPLGNSFNTDHIRHALIAGGGSGIAPFILLAKELKEKKIKTIFLLGARTREDVFLADEFAKYGEVLITTEDGSLGDKGLITQHSIFSKHDFPYDKIFTCGPDPMMKAVARIAAKKGVNCEASLENMMACGFGACLCCVTETLDGNKCVCTAGPVFDTKYLKWQI